MERAEMTRPVKVDHLQSWSRIFRSDQTEMVRSIWCTNWNLRNFWLNVKRPALKVVHFDRSGHFSRSDRNVPFHLTKLLSPVPLFSILLPRTITKSAVAWVRSVQPECAVPLPRGISEILNRNFYWKESSPKSSYPRCSAINTLLRDTGWKMFEILNVEIEPYGISFLRAVFLASIRRK